MLAVIAKHGSQAWFFKLTGPEKEVDKVKPQFNEFVQSVNFGGGSDAEPNWTLPKDWQQLPDDAPQNRGTIRRHATLTVPAGSATLEVSVSSLPLGPFIAEGEGWELYQLQNVNRWRGQLQLLPIRSRKELLATTQQVARTDGAATLVDIAGKPTPGQSDTPSFSGSSAADLPPDHPPIGGTDTDRPPMADSNRAGVQFEAPEGWQPAPLKTFAVLTFEVVEGSEKVDTTVTPVGGGVLFNVDRWCEQPGVNLPRFGTEEKLQSVLQKITVDGAEGVSVELVGQSQTVFGVIVTKDGQQWVVKLMGGNALAQREKQNFAAFVESLKF